MSDQPKVPADIEQLVRNLRFRSYEVGKFGQGSGLLELALGAEHALMRAIAEIEQRAERVDKWKEVAVAGALFDMAKVLSSVLSEESMIRHNRAEKRYRTAIAALGDEWDEAVR